MLPAIISEQEYQAVQSIIQGKTANYRETPQDFIRLRGFLHCKSCGKTLKRHITHSTNIWRCENKSCKVILNHQALMKMLDELMKTIISNQDQITTSVKEPEITESEIAWLNTAFKNELDAPVLDEEKAKSLIFACAVAEYNRIDDGKAVETVQAIKDYLQSTTPETAILDRILKIAIKVYLTPEKILQAELKNGQLIT